MNKTNDAIVSRHADNIQNQRDFRENYIEIDLGQGEARAIIMNILPSELLEKKELFNFRKLGLAEF